MNEVLTIDINRIKKVVEKNINKTFVKNRIEKNLNNADFNINKCRVWKSMVCCLLTTQQKSGPNSAVTKFISTNPFPLDYNLIINFKLSENHIEKILREFGGLRWPGKIAKQVSTNLNWLEHNDGWNGIFKFIDVLKNDKSKTAERRTAEFIKNNLDGFGPKQSRNLLQLLGITRFVIPIDSRIAKWMNRYGVNINTKKLSNYKYYSQIENDIQDICELVGVYPCVLDAVIFSSFDEEWAEESLIW